MSRTHLRTAAALSGAAALTTLSLAPAVGATVVSRSEASALTVSLAGQGQGSGTYAATNDGSRQSTSGTSRPAVVVLPGQRAATAGVLAQEAVARADRTSAACAGLAGRGGSVAQVGDSRCLVPGQSVDASLGSFDLSGVSLARTGSPLDGLSDQAKTALQPLLTPLNSAVDSALTQAQGQLGAAGLAASLGAVEGRCTAGPGRAAGSADLTDARVAVTFAGRTTTLANLPADPPPNTHVVTNLGTVADTVLAAVRADLNTSLDGAGAPLNAALDPVQKQVVDTVLGQLGPQLAPLQKSVLDITLNKQVRPTSDSIQVTALDASVLPAAAPVTGSDLVHLSIGKVTCGPSGRVAPAAAPAPQRAAALPKAVSSGLATAPATQVAQPQSPVSRVVLGAVGVACLLSGAAVLRRRLVR